MFTSFFSFSSLRSIFAKSATVQNQNIAAPMRNLGHEVPLPWAGKNVWHRIKNNLKAGARGAFFMRLAPGMLHATWAQFILFVGLNIALAFASDFARIGLAGEFALYGLPGALFDVPTMLLAAWALARLARRPEQTLLLAMAFSAISIPINICLILIDCLLDYRLIGNVMLLWSPYLFWICVAWVTLTHAAAAIRLFKIPVREYGSVLILAAVLIALPLWKMAEIGNHSLWVQHYDDSEITAKRQARELLQREDIFYLQAKLLDQALSAIKPGTRPGIQLYFVGAAGDSAQDVFMKEVQYVSALFARRYSTENHSISLINNPNTVRETPIASATSLRLALKRIGAVMDRDRDILFLYLSSHGSKEHHFSLDFGSMRFSVLDPRALRQMLDESGIVRRVIVISACYSGGFIDALKTENSLVISAAAADKTSFGCSNEADFTYFGKAYFDEALRNTDSFIDAFELAKPIIAKREKAEDFTGSDPHMFVGAKIKGALDDLARQRAQGGEKTVKPERKAKRGR